MNELLMMGIIYTVFFILVIAGITAFYIYKRIKFDNYTLAVREELGKITRIERRRSELLITELAKLAEWINTDLPNELQVDLIANKQFLKLKNKYTGKDEDFYTALGEISAVIQRKVALKSQQSFDTVNKIVLEEAKDILMKDNKNEVVKKTPK